MYNGISQLVNRAPLQTETSSKGHLLQVRYSFCYLLSRKRIYMRVVKYKSREVPKLKYRTVRQRSAVMKINFLVYVPCHCEALKFSSYSQGVAGWNQVFQSHFFLISCLQLCCGQVNRTKSTCKQRRKTQSSTFLIRSMQIFTEMIWLFTILQYTWYYIKSRF